jgi:DNA-binding protein H-NS
MATYTQIQAQIQKLQREAEALRKRELAETIANIKKAIAAFGLTAEDLGLAGSGKASGKKRGRPAGSKAGLKLKSKKTALKRAKKASRKSALDKRSVVAPKYRNASTGDTWTGRGKQPKWLSAALKSGKKLDDFKI